MKKYNSYLLVLLLVVISSSTFAQYSFDKEKNKYWIYRERLKNFMVSGNCKGCDISSFNRDNKNILYWADAPWMIGYWMGTLAMEYKLLIQSGFSTTSPAVMQTKQDLYRVIESVNRLDYEAEESWGCSPCGNSPCLQNINGFLIADDVPNDFSQVQQIIDGLNEGLVPPPDNYRVKCISSAYTDFLIPGREASKDHLIGLYIGLSLVKKYLPPGENWNNTLFTNGVSEVNTSSFLTEVQIISRRIINNLQSTVWTYSNPCANRCVIGIHNPSNLVSCALPKLSDPCSYTGTGNPPNCCESGGAIALPEAIGFAAADQYIQGVPSTLLAFLISSPGFQLAWSQAINDKNRLVMTLVAIGNVWKFGTCFVNKEITFCDGLCWPNFWNCCHWKTITVPTPTVCSFTTAKISDFLVDIGKKKYWEHLYLIHKILHGGGTETISNEHYECMLNAAPCRGFEGKLVSGSNVEWGMVDRLTGSRGDSSDIEHPYGGWNDDANSGIGYNFYYGLYNLHNPQGSYAPIESKQLAPQNLLKENYTEYDKKNFIAANTITAQNYEVTISQLQEQGRVTFAAGQKIILGHGFKVVGGGYFHGYIDTEIGAMNCSDPPSNTDCSYNLQRMAGNWNDTLNEPDSIIMLLNDTNFYATENANFLNDLNTENNILIYPNPSSGIFTIESIHKIYTHQIEVYDMLGKQIQPLIHTQNNSIQLDISGYSKGLYLIRIGHYTQLFVLE